MAMAAGRFRVFRRRRIRCQITKDKGQRILKLKNPELKGLNRKNTKKCRETEMIFSIIESKIYLTWQTPKMISAILLELEYHLRYPNFGEICDIFIYHQFLEAPIC
jgi:hypothetical protein